MTEIVHNNYQLKVMKGIASFINSYDAINHTGIFGLKTELVEYAIFSYFERSNSLGLVASKNIMAPLSIIEKIEEHFERISENATYNMQHKLSYLNGYDDTAKELFISNFIAECLANQKLSFFLGFPDTDVNIKSGQRYYLNSIIKQKYRKLQDLIYYLYPDKVSFNGSYSFQLSPTGLVYVEGKNSNDVCKRALNECSDLQRRFAYRSEFYNESTIEKVKVIEGVCDKRLYY